MSIKEISTDELRRMKDREGIVFQGCGGSLDEWVDGVNEMLTESGILQNGTKFTDVYSFENDNLTNLLFPFDEKVNLDIGKLAMWRIASYQQFYGSWLSDYVDNYLDGFIDESVTAESQKCYLTKQGIERMRSSLASDIFQQDLISVYEKQTEHRREIKENSKDIMDKIISEINSGTYDNPLLEEKLLLLAEKLSRTSGKKVYGYLKADVKNLIDSIVDLIADDERVSKLYDLWYENKLSIIRTYTDETPDKIPLSQNKEFKSIKNMVITQAMNIFAEKDAFDDNDGNIEKEFEQSEEYDNEQYEFTDNTIENLYQQAQNNNSYAQYKLGKMYLYGNGVEKNYDIAMHYLNLSAEHGNQYAEQLLYSIQKQKNIMTAMSSLRLLQHISNLIRRKNQEQNRRKIGQIDRKMQQKISEKKQAHGLKPSM